MKKILQKISWKTRKWNTNFSLLNFYFNDKFERWGIELLKFQKNNKEYSLFSLIFILPNNVNINKILINKWDFVYLHNYLYEKYEKLDDIKIWGNMSKKDKLIYNILKKIV